MSGDRNEREFVRMMNDTSQWWAQRAAASGRGTSHDLPDVTFAADGVAFAGELKADASKYLYVDEEKMKGLRAYASAYGMNAVAIHRRNGDRSYYVYAPDDMTRTDAGTYRGNPRADEHSIRIKEPEGTAEGILPSDLTSALLQSALTGAEAIDA
jgi:Holliday junction resolvase